MEYLKNVVPSQLIAERGSNLVVINPGSANVRIGFAHQALPFNVPHCIARHIKEPQGSRSLVKDQLLNSQVTTPSQQSERKNAYDAIAALLKIPTLHDEVVENSSYHKMGQGEVYNLQLHSNNRTDSTFAWTNVMLRNQKLSPIAGADGGKEITDDSKTTNDNDCGSFKYKDFICGEEALTISSSKPYCLCNPIRRGRFNVSESYSLNQILEDLSTIWDWILNEKLQIPRNARSSCSAVLVVPETFDPREIKESISIVLQDLGFSTAVVHQEGLAATSGNGLSTACVVNLGAQVTSVICIEDGVALPSTTITLPFGGDDISRCLLWVQETHQTWPNICTRPLQRSIDLFMLNKIKESSCQIREGEFDDVSLVNSFEEDMSVGCYKSRLSSLNVPPMGLFFPELLLPEVYPPPPLPWFCDYEDMLDDPWRPDNFDNMYLGSSTGPSMWDSYPVFPTRTKRVDKVGLADAITNSILSTGRIDLQRKLFCSIQLIGGVALTSGIVAATEDRVLHAIPSNEAIDTVEEGVHVQLRNLLGEWNGNTNNNTQFTHFCQSSNAIQIIDPLYQPCQVLQSRSNPTFVPWKGGAILGILDFGRESWIHREDWIQNAIHVGSGRKYKDSYYLQALAMSYINY